jgi:hypothetical protein
MNVPGTSLGWAASHQWDNGHDDMDGVSREQALEWVRSRNADTILVYDPTAGDYVPLQQGAG